MERLCEVRPKMKAQEEAIYSYDMKWKRFTRLENQLTFVTKVESEENILIGKDSKNSSRRKITNIAMLVREVIYLIPIFQDYMMA